jgi:hypothetical protein
MTRSGRKDPSNHLDPEQRAATVRETFECITAVGFMKWKAEELALGNELTEEDRKLYFREFEKNYFTDFQKMTANASDDRLLDAMEFWIDKANTMGLKEWQEVLSAGQGGAPWYEALGKEIAAEMARSIPDTGDQIGWDDEIEHLGPDWDLSRVRPVTRGLIEAIALDMPPTPAAANDFGIASQQHYEAIYYPLRNDEITFKQLDDAYGNGPALTGLFNAASSNPHKGIVFETPWDHMLGRPEVPKPAEQGATVAERTSVLGYALSEPAPEPSPQQERTKDRTSGR